MYESKPLLGETKKPFSMMEKQRKKAWTMSHLLHTTATLAMQTRRSIDRRRAIELHMYSLTHSVNDELLGVLVYYEYDDVDEAETNAIHSRIVSLSSYSKDCH